MPRLDPPPIVAVLVSVVALAPALTPTAVPAQVPGDGAREGLYVGALAGHGFEASPEFSEQHICPDESPWEVGARAGYRLASILSVEATASHRWEDPDLCVNGFGRPPPENGTVESVVFDEEVEGYPYGAFDARVVVHPVEIGGLVSPHLAAGAGWFPSKEIGHLLAGVGVRVGHGPLQATVEAEGLWYDVPFETVVETYEDGELVDVQRTPGEESESPIRLRAGVIWYP